MAQEIETLRLTMYRSTVARGEHKGKRYAVIGSQVIVFRPNIMHEYAPSIYNLDEFEARVAMGLMVEVETE